MFFAKKTLASQKRSGPPSLLVSTSGVKVRPEPTRHFKGGVGGTFGEFGRSVPLLYCLSFGLYLTLLLGELSIQEAL